MNIKGELKVACEVVHVTLLTGFTIPSETIKKGAANFIFFENNIAGMFPDFMSFLCVS